MTFLLEQIALQRESLATLKRQSGGGTTLEVSQTQMFAALLKTAIDLCFAVNFSVALERIQRIPIPMEGQSAHDVSTVIAALGTIQEAIYDETSARYFLAVSPDRIEYVEYPPKTFPFQTPLQNHTFWGNGANTAFPLASPDIRAAGNCLAAECPTAAVFHAMRVAEYGLRALGKKLKVKLTQDKKPLPIDFATWGTIICGIKRKLTTIRESTQNAKRQTAIAYYSDMADRCAYMKDLWRDDISHARRQFNRQEAVAVLGRVREFMQLLEKMP